MYDLFVAGVPEREIAATLNQDGVRTDLGRPWTRGTVHQVLTNPKYAGDNVYNRVSNRLKRCRVVNTPERWIVARDAFRAAVPRDLFERARAIVEGRSKRYDDAELLALLSGCCGQPGHCRASSSTSGTTCRRAASTADVLAAYYEPIRWWGTRRAGTTDT